jgi:membrane protein
VPALVASVFTAGLYEVAKRLFALYVREVAAIERFSFDANIGAIILFVLWIFYTAFVFLLGGVVAQTWELRTRTESQRARFS